MPVWISVVLGIVAGCAVVAGALTLAIRPYLAVQPPRAWMADPAEGGNATAVYGTDALKPGDFNP